MFHVQCVNNIYLQPWWICIQFLHNVVLLVLKKHINDNIIYISIFCAAPTQRKTTYSNIWQKRKMWFTRGPSVVIPNNSAWGSRRGQEGSKSYLDQNALSGCIVWKKGFLEKRIWVKNTRFFFQKCAICLSNMSKNFPGCACLDWKKNKDLNQHIQSYIQDHLWGLHHYDAQASGEAVEIFAHPLTC